VTAAPSESQRWAKPAAADFDGHLVLRPARGGRNRRMRDLVACLRGLIGDAELRPPPPPPPAEAMAIRVGTGRVDLVVGQPPQDGAGLAGGAGLRIEVPRCRDDMDMSG